jgi:hypothetical protein
MNASPTGTSEPLAAETGSRRDGVGRRSTALSGMRPAFAVRHRRRWPGNGILRLRILRVRKDTVWIRGFATGRARRRHASGVFTAAPHRRHDVTLTRPAIASNGSGRGLVRRRTTGLHATPWARYSGVSSGSH